MHIIKTKRRWTKSKTDQEFLKMAGEIKKKHVRIIKNFRAAHTDELRSKLIDQEASKGKNGEDAELLLAYLWAENRNNNQIIVEEQ